MRVQYPVTEVQLWTFERTKLPLINEHETEPNATMEVQFGVTQSASIILCAAFQYHLFFNSRNIYHIL